MKTIHINNANMQCVVEIRDSLQNPYVVVNMDQEEVIYVSSLDGVKGYIAGAKGAGVVTAKMETFLFESLCSKFIVTGYSYREPVTGNGLWNLQTPKITDDGKVIVASVDMRGNTYFISWDRDNPSIDSLIFTPTKQPRFE